MAGIMNDGELSLEVQVSQRQLQALDVAQLVYLLVRIRPPESHREQRAPLNLCLVIDRSKSMNGARLNRVKAAAALLIERLATSDFVSLVAFSDRAEVVLPAQRVGNRIALVSQVNSIIATGGTEIYQGLSAGVEELRRVATPDHIRHLILLTDGHTYGDAAACLELADEAAADGIGFSAFGLGSEWNDQFLDLLVAPSGGQSAFIESPQQIVDYLQEKIEGLGNIYAQGLNIATQLPTTVSLGSGYKTTPYAQPLTPIGSELRLGTLEGDVPVTCLLELNVQPQPTGRSLSLTLQISATILETNDGQHTAVAEHTVPLTVVAHPVALSPPPDILEAVQGLTFHRMNEQAWQDAESGQVDDATRRMNHLTNRLMEAGFQGLARQAKMETQRLEKLGTMSLEGRKRLKFGTRALLSSSEREE